MAIERTLSIIKPDGVEKAVIGKVIGRFRATGVRPKACERLKAAGVVLPPSMFEGITEVK